MKNKILQLPFILIISLLSCTPEETTLRIVRHPLIRFDYDSSTSWKATSHSISKPTQAVVYPSDPSLPGTLYNRYTFQAFGLDDKKNNLQLLLVFDTKDVKVLTGDYRPAYTADKGLKEVQVYNLDNGNLASYNMYDTTFSILRIQKQSATERLITGSFQVRLHNTRDTTRKMTITNGTLTDVGY